MLRPALQLRLGQQLTMTPQLQQAIRLLQLPALELQQTVREALEQNVMLEADEDGEGEVPLEAADAASGPAPDQTRTETGSEVAAPAESAAEDASDDGWDEGPGAATSDAPWSGDDRAQEFSDDRGETLQEHLSWQLELARLGAREFAIGRAIIDAVNDDGYLIDSLEDIRGVLESELNVALPEIERVLAVVQAFDPVGVGARDRKSVV